MLSIYKTYYGHLLSPKGGDNSHKVQCRFEGLVRRVNRNECSAVVMQQ